MSEHRATTDALSVVMAVYGSENAKALKDFHRIIAELDYEQTEKLVETLRTVLKIDGSARRAAPSQLSLASTIFYLFIVCRSWLEPEGSPVAAASLALGGI
jgi:hypothetical protein